MTEERVQEIFLRKEDGVEGGVTYKVSAVYLRCSGVPIYLRQRICELVRDEMQSSSCSGTSSNTKIVVKSYTSGTVKDISVKNDDRVKIGSVLLSIATCQHPTMLGNTCGDCGVTIELSTSGEQSNSDDSVAMIHSVPSLKVSMQKARILGQEDKRRLLGTRKLVLLVDLDQTILHTKSDLNPAPKTKDVFSFQLQQLGPWYHTKIRPHVKHFLKSISSLYELHICTFGVREYAHAIARYLDPSRHYFGDRILSRNECLDPLSKKANLRSLFPCGDEMVCIIDDRTDVWSYSPNVVQVLPYIYYEQTGDINAPPVNLAVYVNERHLQEQTRLNAKSSAHSHGVLSRTVQQQQQKVWRQQTGNFKHNSDQHMKCEEKIERPIPEVLPPPAPVDGRNSDSNSSNAYSESEVDSAQLEASKVQAEETKHPNSDSVEKQAEPPDDCAIQTDQEQDMCDVVTSTPDNNTVDLLTKSETVGKDENAQEMVSSAEEKTAVDVKKAIFDVNVSKAKECQSSNDNPEKNTQAGIVTQDCCLESESLATAKTVKQIKAHPTHPEIQPHAPQPEMAAPKTDFDDHLLHLEYILRTLHRKFYSHYDSFQKVSHSMKIDSSRTREYNCIENSQKSDSGETSGPAKKSDRSDNSLELSDENSNSFKSIQMPDLKEIVPKTRQKVLKGCNIVFTGVVPRGVDLQKSKPYNIAISLGARVTEDFVVPTPSTSVTTYDATTHIVSANLHTVKMKQAQRLQSKGHHFKVVTPDWLWGCWERWRWLDEARYPLNTDTEKTLHRSPPPYYYCFVQPQAEKSPESLVKPLLLLGSSDKQSLINEVMEECATDSDDEAETGESLSTTMQAPSVPLFPGSPHRSSRLVDMDNSSSDDEELTKKSPHKRRKRRLRRKSSDETTPSKRLKLNSDTRQTDDEGSSDTSCAENRVNISRSASSLDHSSDIDLDSDAEESLRKLEQELMEY